MAELNNAGDPGRMDTLAQEVDTQSKKLTELGTRLQIQTKSLKWNGSDKEKFQGAHTNTVLEHVKNVVAELKRVSSVLKTNADEQRKTSTEE